VEVILKFARLTVESLSSFRPRRAAQLQLMGAEASANEAADGNA
jgi:hypothetical protein